MSVAHLEALVEGAVRASKERRWAEAGQLYARAAAFAMEHQALESARRAWEAAGEAWRRADRPTEASRALRMALGLPQTDPVATALDRVRLAGVLSEVGNGQAALQLCRRAVDDLAPGVQARAVAVDALLGTLLGFGRKEAARACLAELEDPTARAFREGALLRLDGDLPGAAARFEAVLEALAGRPEAEAGRAAALGELAEVALLDGRAAEAVERFREGEACHREAGRRSMAWRCEAGRVRASVEAGAEPLTAELDRGLAVADERGMVLLAVDLQLARGVALARRDPEAARAALRWAVTTGDRCGTRLRAGRARYELARLSEGAAREALLTAAEALLEDHVVLAAHARAARGGDPAS